MRYIDIFLEHLFISFSSLILSLILAVFLVYLSSKNRLIKNILLNLSTVIYAIPSLSMFSLLIPFLGLGKITAIFSLVIYSQYILVRSIISLLDNFDESLSLASEAMGLSKKDILFRIKLPLLENELINTIKITISMIISITNIAYLINAGGIGELIFDGLRTMRESKIILAIILNILVYFIFLLIIRGVKKAYKLM